MSKTATGTNNITMWPDDPHCDFDVPMSNKRTAKTDIDVPLILVVLTLYFKVGRVKGTSLVQYANELYSY